MRSGRQWMFLVLAVVLFASCALEVSGMDVATFHTCTKLSDTQLQVDLICEQYEWYYYQYYFSDVVTTERVLNGYFIQHIFSDVSVDSFPLHAYVYLFENEQTSEPSGFEHVVIDCAELFAPEIEVLSGGVTIPDGGTHDAGAQAPGEIRLCYTVDNTAGAGNLIVDSATASAMLNCSGFSVETALPLTVACGETNRLCVSLTLEDPGEFVLQLEIASNDPDTDPYSFNVSGSVMTPEQAALGGATQQIVPLGQGGEETVLDQAPVLDDSGNAVMAGNRPLSGVYHAGDIVSGAAMVCDPAMNPLRSAWIHAFLYSVDVQARPEGMVLLDHWMIRYDHDSCHYAVAWNTEGMTPGVYDIYLSLGSQGRGTTLRVQLVDPDA